MTSDYFQDASGLLALLIGTINGKIDEPYDLSKLPIKMRETEKKYWLTKEEKVDRAISEFLGKIGKLIYESGALIEHLSTFVGVDQCFVVRKKEARYIFRYRLGANRLPQLTVKFQINKDSNIQRGEINLNMKQEEPEKVRAFLGVICALSDSYNLFTIQQSGNIWTFRDPRGELLELVVYKVADVLNPAKIKAFVEIEALNIENFQQAMELINKYEKLLGVGESVCEKSIAELFGPQNGEN